MFSRENEYEPAFLGIRGPSRSVNDRHLCMCDERRRCDFLQNFQHSANYVHEELSRDKQAVAFSSRVSTLYARNAWDLLIWRPRQYYWGMAVEAPVICDEIKHKLYQCLFVRLKRAFSLLIVFSQLARKHVFITNYKTGRS